MRIKKIDLRRMRNDEFFQFFTRVRNMIVAATPVKLKIEKAFEDFKDVYAKLDASLKKIIKSSITPMIGEAITARNKVFRGLALARKANSKHFMNTVREATERLTPVFETYGDLTALANDESTSAMYNFCKDLMESYAEDLITAGLAQWVTELDKMNKAVETLMMQRFEERSARTNLKIRDVRIEMGELWSRIADRINSLELVEGENEGAPWAAFIKEFNGIATRTEHIIAIRRGKAKAKKEGEEASTNGDTPADEPEV